MKKRKANRYTRGNKFELDVKKGMEKRGYICYKPIRTRFAKQKDIFGMWDLICWNPKYGVLSFYQLTTDENIAKKRAEEKLKNFDIKYIEFEIGSPKVWYGKIGSVKLNEMKEYPVIDRKNLIRIRNTASEGEAP